MGERIDVNRVQFGRSGVDRRSHAAPASVCGDVLIDVCCEITPGVLSSSTAGDIRLGSEPRPAQLGLAVGNIELRLIGTRVDLEFPCRRGPSPGVNSIDSR
jgi:hypothetical protein